MHEYTFLMLDDIPVTIWHDGTVDIHVPDTKSSGTVFGLGWERYQSFSGNLIGSWHPFTVTSPKIGQKARLYNADIKHSSIPVTVRAVYHNGNPMGTTSIWQMVETHQSVICYNHGFTSFGEDAKYSVTIARFLALSLDQNSDRVNETSLVKASMSDTQTVNIYKIIDDLVAARVVYRNNGHIVADTALYHILRQAINRMHTMSTKPFSNTD